MLLWKNFNPFLNFDLDNDPRAYRCKNQEDAYQELTRLEDHFLLSEDGKDGDVIYTRKAKR